MDVVVFDAAGNWDTAVVQSIAPDALAIADRPGPRTVTYTAGAHVTQFVESTFYLDQADGTLRREHPGVSNLPLLDNVVDSHFEYFGDPAPPVAPRPPVGTANCLYDAVERVCRSPHFLPIMASLAKLPIALFGDGPMCGSGATAYDADLLRIRQIRVAVVLQTGVAMLRGQAGRLFARPGLAHADRIGVCPISGYRSFSARETCSHEAWTCRANSQPARRRALACHNTDAAAGCGGIRGCADRPHGDAAQRRAQTIAPKHCLSPRAGWPGPFKTSHR